MVVEEKLLRDREFFFAKLISGFLWKAARVNILRVVNFHWTDLTGFLLKLEVGQGQNPKVGPFQRED